MSLIAMEKHIGFESKRIKKFRLGLVKAIPKFPNNRETEGHLRQKNLAGILIDFVNWKSRYVGARPREVFIRPAAAVDRRWTAKSPELSALLTKIRKGEDLTPHLSQRPHTRGFTPAASARGASIKNKWSDKDFILATQGYHHFHITPQSNDLMFAHVTREDFHVIALFDHSVFDSPSPERDRLYRLHDEYVFGGLAPGAVVIGAAITTSGHACQTVLYAKRCARTVTELDQRLEEPQYTEQLYASCELIIPQRPKLDWAFNHLDLGVYDGVSNVFFTFMRGWN